MCLSNCNTVNRPRERPKLYFIKPVDPRDVPSVRDFPKVRCLIYSTVIQYKQRTHRLLNQMENCLDALFNCVLAA